MNFDDNKIKHTIMDILKKFPNLTASQIWLKISLIRRKSPKEYREIKRILTEEDQSIRLLLAEMEEDNLVTYSIRCGSILKEWRLV